MTDLVQNLVAALTEVCSLDPHESSTTEWNAALRKCDDALSEAKAGGWVAAHVERAVPSLDSLKQHLACGIECSIYENTVLPAIERWEAHHGIAAPEGKSKKKI